MELGNIMSREFLKNKKADFISFNVVFHILEIIFIITVGVFVFFIVHVEKDINTFPIESEILFNRIVYSNNGLWFYDEGIDRLYPGILEFENFNDKEKIEESLNKAMYYGEGDKRVAVELILKEGEIRFGPVYYNEEKYKEWIEQYKAGWTEGAGGKKGKTRQYNILIKRGEDLVPGILDIAVLIPNR
jgi:hypothetical protein